MYFTVKAWNFENQVIPLSGFVEDEDGTVVKSISGFAGRLPANAKNYTLTAFSLNVYGVGNHTYKLFLDNADGKPNGVGEEHWSKVRIEVKPSNGTLKQVGFECSDLYFTYDMGNYKASLTCRFSLYNGYPFPVYINGSVISTLNMSPKIILQYLNSKVLNSISKKTLLPNEYLTITSTAHFFVPKPDWPIISQLFPQIADAGADIKAESIYGITAVVSMTYDVPVDIHGDSEVRRYYAVSSIYVNVDQKAVVTDIMSDIGLTYATAKGVNAIGDISLFKKFVKALPPEYRGTLRLLGQISLNYVKETIITNIFG